MTTDLRIGIVGFGHRAQLTDQVQRPGRGSFVSAVLDTAERGRADARERLPNAFVTDTLDDFISAGVDAALVLTPDDQHTDVTVALLEAGVPVFCEKPLATKIADADTILEAAHRTGTRLYVGHNMRHMPVIVLMRQLILDGRIGEVKAIWCRHFVGHGGDYYFKDWHADRRRTTGLLLQKGAHDIDVLHWLGGARTMSVNAMGALAVYGDITDRSDHAGERMQDWFSLNNWPPTAQTGMAPILDVEDLSQVNMTLSNGVLASYQQCHFTPDYWRNYTVIGSEGRLENFGDEIDAEVRIWRRRTHGAGEPDEVHRVTELAEGASAIHGGADDLLIAEFLRFVRHGGRTDTSPVAARDAVATGIAATESIRSGGHVQNVPALSPELVAYFEGGQSRSTSDPGIAS
ncbi:Gfo/Idh/MocA family protein [Zhihengliuella sp. ISTPL4]|uniref:Gfo/Idh/MocA family protein n=1 Tax=Zhihengliuella sp. ISTPL4 TaxID=2058657 RepID=UPI000C7A4D0B|nr:Gfo/Idh/MocA family oxidoreductase [Zhihengliuella sp. ISTPL4]